MQSNNSLANDHDESLAGQMAETSQVKYVLSGQPTGFAAMADKMREYDEEKVKDVKEDIDTLLVFVCSSYDRMLFSE
jgi:hypothetical protein